MEDFIAFDWCGAFEQYGRFTHISSGETIVWQGWMRQDDWDAKQLEFFQKYPGVTVYKCLRSYNDKGESMGTTEEICERLKIRLNRQA